MTTRVSSTIRQYFNVIKTEDGRSKFYKTVDEKSEQDVKIVEEKMRYPVEVDSTRDRDEKRKKFLLNSQYD